MRRLAGCLLAALLLSACGGPDPVEQAALMTFDTATVHLAGAADTLPVLVEVASTPNQRAVGLMERPSLDEGSGMIFVFPDDQPAEAGFWMFHTLIPLDIAYVDAEGTIVSIRSMDPCPSPDPRWCDTYPSGVPYRYTLEVNRGFFERHGIGVGDRLLIPEEVEG